MKRVLACLVVAFLLTAGRVAQATPPLPPSPTEWVTDTAGFLSEPTRQALNTRLEAYERASGHQVLVWIGKTTGETPLEDWTVHAFQAWHVGRKGLDDGLVLFVFAEDRKARIEVGYGLEGQVPDAVASRILRDAVLPRIQAGDQDGAVTTGVNQLLDAMGGETASPQRVFSKPLGWLQILLLVLGGIVLLFLALRFPTLTLYLLAIFARSGGGSGGFGGGGGRSGGGGASGKW